ncbi:MAG: integrin alpha [Caldilineaceae bacterium]
MVYSGVDRTILHDLTTPAEAPENFGASVAGAGDISSDGYADLLVGANRADVQPHHRYGTHLSAFRAVTAALFGNKQAQRPRAC